MSPLQLETFSWDGIQFIVNMFQVGQGTGRGLFISKGVVKHHHGSQIATSKGIGKGTTFTVPLPLQHALVVEDDADKEYEHCPESLLSNEEPADASGGTPSSTVNVLVMDGGRGANATSKQKMGKSHWLWWGLTLDLSQTNPSRWIGSLHFWRCRNCISRRSLA